jgi:hypothetical protein
MLLECVAAADFLQAFSSIMMKGDFLPSYFFCGFEEFLSAAAASNMLLNRIPRTFFLGCHGHLLTSS